MQVPFLDNKNNYMYIVHTRSRRSSFVMQFKIEYGIGSCHNIVTVALKSLGISIHQSNFLHLHSRTFEWMRLHEPGQNIKLK
jgi:hypothetical protein